MFPFTVGPPCERVLFDHSPFYGGSLLRPLAGSAATATLRRFVSTRSDYLDAIQAMFRFTIRDVLWLTVVVALTVGLVIDRVSVEAECKRLKEEVAAEHASLAIEHKMAKIREAEAQANSVKLMETIERIKARAAANQSN